MVVEKYRIKIEDLPSWEDGGNGCKRYEAKLCRDLPCGLPPHETSEVEAEKSGDTGGGDVDEPTDQNGDFDTMKASKDDIASDLVCTFRQGCSRLIYLV